MLTDERSSPPDIPTQEVSPTSDMSPLSHAADDMRQPDIQVSEASECLVSVAEFSRRLGKSERTVQRWVHRGIIRATMVSGAARIPESELQRFDPTSDTDTVSPTSDMSDRPRKPTSRAGAPSDGPSPSWQDLLERHEAAMVRLGWLESELQSARRALTDGGASASEVQARLQAETEARRQAELEAARADEVRLRAEAAEQREREALSELITARLRLAELEAAQARMDERETQRQRPWWKKVFSPSRHHHE